MSLFGAIVRTAVNVVKLPVSLPLAALKDVKSAVEDGECSAEHVRGVVEDLKEDADA